VGDESLYEFRLDETAAGWWKVLQRIASDDLPGKWQVIARVRGEKRAEIVRDALSAEANEHV